MPALNASSQMPSFYVHDDPSFYESHQNIGQSHQHVHYASLFARNSSQQQQQDHHQPIARHRPPQVFHPPQSMQQPPPPQALAHKVWILDCRSCKTFFTNRGMKAVLLLRPNVPLYSTDALPANCSAYSTNPEVSCVSPPSQSGDPVRTCECLTQTLCCHGCGNIVGYMIVIPCHRCTSSMSASNRATNGHRFVFHSSEISASERHYILGEPGVSPHHTLSASPCPPQYMHPSSVHPIPVASLSPVRLSPNNSSDLPQIDYFPMPPGNIINEARRIDVPLDSRASSPPVSPAPPTASSIGSNIQFARPTLPLQPPMPVIVKLMQGEVLYWHHLTKHGEIPGVEEDDRARGVQYKQDSRKEITIKGGEWKYEGGIKLRGVPVMCGR